MARQQPITLDGRLTYAALILFGTRAAMGRHLARAEVVKDTGSRLSELMQVLPALSDNQVKKLVAELQTEGKTYHTGTTRAALWYPKK